MIDEQEKIETVKGLFKSIGNLQLLPTAEGHVLNQQADIYFLC